MSYLTSVIGMHVSPIIMFPAHTSLGMRVSPHLGPGLLCQHNFEHNTLLKASSIMPAYKEGFSSLMKVKTK